MPQPKVLIVDDDAHIRDVLSDVLSGEPYTLLEAADGQQALELANKELPDLILLDIMMPGMDGSLILRKLKKEEKTRAIPVIVITALNLDTQISACLDDGAVDHICKPFSSMVVRSRVRAALRNRTQTGGYKLPAAKTGRVLGFIGAKGGVGTTAVAVNVALSLLQTKAKKTVALAEIRSHAGTVAAQLGASSSLNTENLLRQEQPGEIEPQMLSRFLTHHPTGLQLLLAPPDMDDEQEITAQRAEEIVKGLAAMADFVVLDIPKHPCKVAKATLRLCDFVALVVEMESTCLAAAPAMLKAMDSWGVGGPLVRVVLVQHIIPDTSVMSVGHARDSLACPLVGVIPPAPELCARALRVGSPLVISEPDSMCATALAELAEHLTAENVPVLTF